MNSQFPTVASMRVKMTCLPVMKRFTKRKFFITHLSRDFCQISRLTFISPENIVEFLMIHRIFEVKFGDGPIVNVNKFAGNCGCVHVY